MKKALNLPKEHANASELACLPGGLSSDAGSAELGASESNAMVRDFAEDLQSLLESIASLCEALHAPALDHWSLSQRKVIDSLEKAFHEAATVVDQVYMEFDVPNRELNPGPQLSDKTTH